MDDHPHRTVVFVVDGPLAPADVPGLCRRVRVLMERPGVARVVCDVGALVVPDGVAVDALARLQLAARRRGCRVALRHAPAELLDLLELAGLTEIVPLESWDDDAGGWRCEA
ncbi:MAG TPA: STAS domain-containing protein [Jiangellaceae bacterium]